VRRRATVRSVAPG